MFNPLKFINRFRKPNNTPLLTAGLDPVLDRHQIERQNNELTTRKLLGGISVDSSAWLDTSDPDAPKFVNSGYALFTQPNYTTAIEVHITDERLKPYPLIVGDATYMAPALFKFPERGLLDFQVLLTAHRPELEPFYRHMAWLESITENEELRTFQERIKAWANPRNAGVARILWIMGQANYILPLRSGEKRGLGGKIPLYRHGGGLLGSLVHRRPPQFRYLQPDTVGRMSRFYQLEQVGLETIIDETDFLIVEGTPYRFFKGGVVDSATFSKLSALNVDILLRLEFLDGSDKLWVTPLLRASGSKQELEHIYESLKNIGGWTAIRGRHQLPAFQAFIPGNPPIDPSYGHRQVIGWANTDPDLGPIGLLQQIATKLTPVGDPEGSLVLGKVAGRPFTIDPKLIASIFMVGPSKKSGKTGSAMLLAHQLNPRSFWVDLTAAPMDRVVHNALRFGGTVWQEEFPDAENIIISRGEKPTPETTEALRQELEEQDAQRVQEFLQGMLAKWRKQGRVTGLPFVLHPSKNSDRYLNVARLFLTELSSITQEWMMETEEYFLLAVNDFSALHSRRTKGNAYQQQLAIDLAEAAAWWGTQGYNHGIDKYIVISHDQEDPNKILGRNIRDTFSLLMQGGLKGYPDFNFQVIVPETNELLATVSLQVTDEAMLEYLDRLSPAEAKQLEADLATNRPTFSRNGSKERRNVRSGT